MPGVTERVLTTPVGEARLVIAAARSARGVLALGHGAGGGIGARDLVALAAALPGEGITVVRVEQPWRVAGKKAAPAPATLDRAWLAALADLPRDVPLAVGGRSAGARVACRTAQDVGAAGVIALAFPLHPPGRPELQGERDPFGRPEEFPAGPFELVAVAHADHGLSVPAAHDQRETTERIVKTVRDWLGNVFAAAKR